MEFCGNHWSIPIDITMFRIRTKIICELRYCIPDVVLQVSSVAKCMSELAGLELQHPSQLVNLKKGKVKYEKCVYFQCYACRNLYIWIK